MNTPEKIEALEAAEEHIAEAIRLLKAVVGDNEHLRRTMIANLEITIGVGGWMARETTIPELVAELAEETEDCPVCGAPVTTEDAGTPYMWQHCMATGCDWERGM